MARDGTVTVKITGDAKGLHDALGDSDGHLNKFGGKMGSVAKGVGLGFAAMGAAGGAFGIKTLSVASDVEESFSKVNTIFGKSGGEIDKWAKGAATNIGLSRGAALDAAGTFGNMFTQLGIGVKDAGDMSLGMVDLAADFASFHNADISEVIAAQSAAFRGEYDSLQRFLPLINAANVEQKALAMTGKKATAELTAQEKALAVERLMLQGAGEAAGDFARTSDGMANQLRILKAEGENFMVTVGSALMPIMMRGLEVFKSFTGFVKELGDAFSQGGAGGAVDFLVEKFKAAWPAIEAALGSIINGIGSWISGTAVPYLQAQFPVWVEAMWKWIQHVTPPALRALGQFAEAIGRWVIDTGLPWLAQKLVELGKALWKWIQDATPPALGKLVELLAQLGQWVINEGIPKLVGFMATMGTKLISWIADVIPQLPGKLGEFMGKFAAWVVTTGIPKIVEMAGKMSEAILGFLSDAAKAAPGKAAEVIAAIAEWLATKGPGLIGDAMRLIVSAITAPFKVAFNTIAGFWNNTVGKINFSVPDWVPGIGGKGFEFPKVPILHAGGVVPGVPGSDVLALLQAGERVLPRGGTGAASGGMTLIINSYSLHPDAAGPPIIEAIKEYERRNGTNWRVA